MARSPRPTPEGIEAVRRRHRALLEQDLHNVEEGIYPASLLFNWSHLDAVAWPGVLRDVVSVARRREDNAWRVPPELGESFPRYYRRRYHWQVDGYLTDRSARHYDLQVEVLFMGAADAMRRQVIPPIVAALPDHGTVIDVACGTGRTLSMLAAARPDGHYIGVEMSPAYIRRARRTLTHVPNLSLLVHDGRALPFPDDYAPVVTSTYLFHELPTEDRRGVLAEMFRVCAPGGTVVIEDAAQLSEAPELEHLLRAFAKNLHEPYFDGYLSDPLEDAMEEAGFEGVEVSSCYVAKVVTARKPG